MLAVITTQIELRRGNFLDRKAAQQLTETVIRGQSKTFFYSLADWPAETYQVEVGDASLDARQMALEIERRSIQDKFTFQRVNNLVRILPACWLILSSSSCCQSG
jgi:hypothetical protein